jgi:hypothetical protein
MKIWKRIGIIVLDILVVLVILVILLNTFSIRVGVTNEQATETLPGDSIFPTTWVTLERATTLPVSAQTAWPWVAQLGYQRGGWYAPLWLENALHEYSASSTLPEFQNLQVGQIVPDFGGGKLKVLAVEPDHYVVYGSISPSDPPTTTNYHFTWALVLENDTASTTSFHLRLRIPKAPGQWWVPPAFPSLIDLATDEVMFAGLKEQLQKHDQ